MSKIKVEIYIFCFSLTLPLLINGQFDHNGQAKSNFLNQCCEDAKQPNQIGITCVKQYKARHGHPLNGECAINFFRCCMKQQKENQNCNIGMTMAQSGEECPSILTGQNGLVHDCCQSCKEGITESLSPNK